MDDVSRFRISRTLLLLFAGAALISCTVTAQETNSEPPAEGTPLRVSTQEPQFGQIRGSKRAAAGKSELPNRLPIKLVAAEEPIASETTEEVLDEKQESVTSELRVAMLQEKAAVEATAAVEEKPSAEATNVDLLKQLDVTIAQQKLETKRLKDAEAQKVDVELQLNKLADGRLEEDPPYSIIVMDKLRDSINNGKAKQEAIEASLFTASEAVERARAAVDQSNVALRQLKEKTPAEDPSVKAAELEVRLAEETLVLRRQELASGQTNDAIREIQTSIDEKKLEIVRRNVHFSKETLTEQLAEIDVRESSLKRKVAALKSEINYAEQRWMRARQEIDSAATPTPAMIAMADALNTAKQTSQLEETAVNQRLQRLPQSASSWQRRYWVVSDDFTREERNTWLAEAESQLETLKRERRSRELKMDEIRVNLGSIDSQIDAVNGSDPELKRWLEIKRKSLSKQIEIYNDSMLAIDGVARTVTRLQFQITGDRSRSLSEWAADTWAWVKRAWNYELANVSETSLTIGKVLSSILFLFFGYFAARWLSRLLGRRLPNIGIDEAGANAIETLSFYVMLIAFGLAALKYANVPLTVFTFLGGAIAIGVGFGSQNILNNFISGLILLAERPIKVGDLILIDTIHGNVTQIGARSTQIRTGDNQDIIVPNSKFLENNVVNLTRRDDRLRTSINVGVSYGSPLDKVIKLLRQAASEHPSVHAKPTPLVWFTDFGDNSLMFQIHFWITARTVTQMRNAETEVRLSIDRLFRENDIVIAFPQRDLHIQSPKPLEFRLIGNEDTGDDLLRKTG